MRCVLPHLLVAVVVAVVLLGTASAFSVTSFGTKVLTRSRMQFFASTAEAESTYESKFNPRDDRRRIMKSENYNRMGFKEQKKVVEEMMKTEFASPLLQEMRANGGVLTRGDLTIRLAEHYGFCWGVERSIAMAYEARAHFPDKTLHITNEIIHNPQVNDRLHEMQVQFLENEAQSKDKSVAKDFSRVQEGDVVILPAFGATIQELQLLEERKVTIVDTTCPWVSKVWNAVDNHRKAGQTSIIHGKYSHEETIATASYCDHYLVLKDLADAQYVANYIVHGGDKAAFQQRFAKAMSPGFDPDVHLAKIGLANQTTMYKRETRAIGRVLEVALLQRYGPANLSDHYAEFDTICDATQERQDAVTALVTGASYEEVMRNEAANDNKHDHAAPNPHQLDLVLVVGGFDSSNTAHLQEIPEKYGVRAYHIDSHTRIRADNSIEHRSGHSGEVVVEKDWLRKGPMTIGVTSGASTPDRCVEEALEQLFLLHKLL